MTPCLGQTWCTVQSFGARCSSERTENSRKVKKDCGPRGNIKTYKNTKSYTPEIEHRYQKWPYLKPGSPFPRSIILDIQPLVFGYVTHSVCFDILLKSFLVPTPGSGDGSPFRQIPTRPTVRINTDRSTDVTHKFYRVPFKISAIDTHHLWRIMTFVDTSCKRMKWGHFRKRLPRSWFHSQLVG